MLAMVDLYDEIRNSQANMEHCRRLRRMLSLEEANYNKQGPERSLR
jgi:hypothetical protein